MGKKKKFLQFEGDGSFNPKWIISFRPLFRDSQNHCKIFCSTLGSVNPCLVDLLGMPRTCLLILS